MIEGIFILCYNYYNFYLINHGTYSNSDAKPVKRVCIQRILHCLCGSCVHGNANSLDLLIFPALFETLCECPPFQCSPLWRQSCFCWSTSHIRRRKSSLYSYLSSLSFCTLSLASSVTWFSSWSFNRHSRLEPLITRD